MKAKFNRIRLWLCARGIHLAAHKHLPSGKKQCAFCAAVFGKAH